MGEPRRAAGGGRAVLAELLEELVVVGEAGAGGGGGHAGGRADAAVQPAPTSVHSHHRPAEGARGGDGAEPGSTARLYRGERGREGHPRAARQPRPQPRRPPPPGPRPAPGEGPPAAGPAPPREPPGLGRAREGGKGECGGMGGWSQPRAARRELKGSRPVGLSQGGPYKCSERACECVCWECVGVWTTEFSGEAPHSSPAHTMWREGQGQKARVTLHTRETPPVCAEPALSSLPSGS